MQDIVLVNLFHSLDDLREDQKILTSIDDATLPTRRHETTTFFAVASL